MKNYLEEFFLNPPDREILIDGIKITPRSFRNFFIEYNGKKKFVKKVLVEQFHRSVLMFEKIPRVDFLFNSQVFVIEKDLFEVVDIDPSLTFADLNCFADMLNVYTYSDRLKFVQRKFADVHYYISETSHTLAPVYGSSLGDIAFKVIGNSNYNLEHCKRGFFHGDFHFGNIMKNDSGLFIIDFSDVKYSYVALNLAQCFLIEVVDKIDAIGIEKIGEVRKTILSKLDKWDAHYFDFLVGVAAYNWYIRMIPNLFPDIKERKSRFVGQLETTLNILLKLQSGTEFPVMGSSCIKDGKIVLTEQQIPVSED